MRNLFCEPLPAGAGEFRLGISGRAYTAPLAFMEQTSGGKPLAECAPQPTHRGNEFFNLGAPATAEGSEWQSRKRVGHSFQTRDARSPDNFPPDYFRHGSARFGLSQVKNLCPATISRKAA